MFYFCEDILAEKALSVNPQLLVIFSFPIHDSPEKR